MPSDHPQWVRQETRPSVVLIQREGKWEEALLTAFVDEHELQKILYDAPNLIPGLVGSAIVREMAIPGAGKADLVAVNEAGEVWLVECKLKAGQESRRAVVGQILSYAGGLWKLGYEGFEGQFSAKAGSPLHEMVADNAVASFDEDKFNEGLRETLDKGSFHLVIAVDQITDELKRIIEFVNETAQSAFSLTVLELGYIHEGNVKLLVPQRYGEEIEALTDAERPGRSGWTLDDVTQAVAQLDSPAREFIETLMTHAAKAGAIFRAGPNTKIPTCGYYYRVAGQTRSVWSIYSPIEGIISINFASVARADPDRAKVLLKALKTNDVLSKRLAEVQPDDLHKFPRLSAKELAEGGAKETLLQGLDVAIDHPSSPGSPAALAG